MKRLVKVLASVLLVSALLYGSVLAYIALTGTGHVTVQEPLSFVGSSSFSVSLYPQQSVSAQLTVANASPVAMDVDLISSVTPEPGAKGLTIGIPNKITVPGNGQTIVTITITAGKSAEPNVYTVSIAFDR